jgi:hypothetical protein
MPRPSKLPKNVRLWTGTSYAKSDRDRAFLARRGVERTRPHPVHPYKGRDAITALHGLRGIGKTALVTACAEWHRSDYRATWWVRARGEPTMRADLVALRHLTRVPPDKK